jgi:AcrR family transcriptional regulator
MDELGQRAGLSGPTLYRYFSGKDEILAALFNEAMDELLSATAMVHDDPLQDFGRLVRHHVGYAVSRRQLVNVYQREDRSLVDPWKRHFSRRRKNYVARWEAVVARCVPAAAAPEVSAMTQTILGLIFSIAYWPPKTAELPGLADLIVGFASEGLSTLNPQVFSGKATMRATLPQLPSRPDAPYFPARCTVEFLV